MLQPTIKQKKAFRKTLENGGNVSKAMLDAGYTPSMAKNPQKLTRSTYWNKMVKQYLPDIDLLTLHKDGLSATRTTNASILLTKDGQMVKAEEQGLIEVPDWATRHKYLDTAYKIKNKYPTEQSMIQQVAVGADMKVEFLENAEGNIK